MIINSLHAENVLKYSTLDLTNLSSRGLIAISGPNESGKSTIGETICFALFGRTYTLDSADPAKLIRWNESRCMVTLDFSAHDGQRYEVTHHLDNDGTHGARLTRAGEDAPLATGVAQVNDAIVRLVGFDFEQFIESFYLPQKELTTSSSHSRAVRKMAGISPLGTAAKELQETIVQDNRGITEIEREMKKIVSQIQDLGVDEEHLRRMETVREEINAVPAAETQAASDVEAVANRYDDNLSRLQLSRKARGTSRFFAIVFFSLAVVLWAVWGLLTQLPQVDFVQQLVSWLRDNVPAWETQVRPWLLHGAAVTTAIFLVSWVGSAIMGSRIKRILSDGPGIADNLREAVETTRSSGNNIEAELDDLIEPALSETTDTDKEAKLSVELLVPESLHTRIAQMVASRDEVNDVAAEVHEQVRIHSVRLDRTAPILQEAIELEREHFDQAEDLKEILKDFQQRIAERTHRVEVRELGLGLLEGASRQISHQFNKDVRSTLAKTLQVFTKGRYEHLQIDDKLNVRVFSSEKRDFMDFEEISIGMQRQILLALRLVLSKKLVKRSISGQQFLFLDEPFAFFDEKHTRTTLAAFPNISDQLSQIWIVTQEFPEDVDTDVHIQCQLDQDSIRMEPVNGGWVSAPARNQHKPTRTNTEN